MRDAAGGWLASDNDMRREVDFKGSIRGKYARQYSRGTNIVVLDPDVAKVSPTLAQ